MEPCWHPFPPWPFPPSQKFWVPLTLLTNMCTCTCTRTHTYMRRYTQRSYSNTSLPATLRASCKRTMPKHMAPRSSARTASIIRPACRSASMQFNQFVLNQSFWWNTYHSKCKLCTHSVHNQPTCRSASMQFNQFVLNQSFWWNTSHS